MHIAEQGVKLHDSQVRERMEGGTNDHVLPLPQISAFSLYHKTHKKSTEKYPGDDTPSKALWMAL